MSGSDKSTTSMVEKSLNHATMRYALRSWPTSTAKSLPPGHVPNLRATRVYHRNAVDARLATTAFMTHCTFCNLSTTTLDSTDDNEHAVTSNSRRYRYCDSTERSICSVSRELVYVFEEGFELVVHHV